MSYIIKDSETLLMLTDDINYMEKYGVSSSFIEEILTQMIPVKDGKPLINYSVIPFDECGDDLVAFIPSKMMIEVSLKKLNDWLDVHDSYFDRKFHLDDGILRGYVVVQILAHEVEHSYQYLMGKNLITAPNDILANAYNGIFDLIINGYDDDRRTLYFSNFCDLLLERNAQIESYDLALKIAEYNSREDIYNAFIRLAHPWITLGYKNSTHGSVSETYKMLKMYRDYLTFNHPIPIDEQERIRHGFSISDKTRQKLLKK